MNFPESLETWWDHVAKMDMWLWFAGALVALIGDFAFGLFAPTAIGFVIVGVLSIFMPVTWTWAIFIIALSVLVMTRFGDRFFGKQQGAPVILRHHRTIGKRVILKEPIIDGSGRAEIDGVSWPISGDDAPAGTRIEVVSADGVLLTVKIID